MKEISGPATADNLGQIIKSTLAEFGLSEINIYAVTTDSGANVIRASTDILQHIDYIISEEDRRFIKSQQRDDDNHEYTLDDEEDLHQEFPALDAAAEEFTGIACVATKCAAHVVQNAVGDFLKRGGRPAKLAELKDHVKEIRKFLRWPITSTPLPRLANDTRWNSTLDMVSF